MKNYDLSEGGNSDGDRVPNKAATPENNYDQGNKQQSNHASLKLQLAPLCENEVLKKDAKFIGKFGMLLQKEETSARLTLQVTNIKKHYIVTRRNIKKHSDMEKNLILVV